MRASDEKRYQLVHYEIELKPGVFSVLLPRDYEWRRLKFFNDKVYFFGLDSKDGSPLEKEYQFEILESGDLVSDRMNQCYVDTFVSSDGTVYHMYEA